MPCASRAAQRATRSEGDGTRWRTLEKSVLLMAAAPLPIPYTVNNNKPGPWSRTGSLFRVSFFVETLVETSTIPCPIKIYPCTFRLLLSARVTGNIRFVSIARSIHIYAVYTPVRECWNRVEPPTQSLDSTISLVRNFRKITDFPIFFYSFHPFKYIYNIII